MTLYLGKGDHMEKQLNVTDEDAKQLVVLAKIIAEGQFQIKGDCILFIADALKYLASLTDRIKQAQPPVQPDSTPAPGKTRK
jgi:hypothetical protein